MRAKEALEILGVSRMSLCNYVKQGKIKVKEVRNKNQMDYDDNSVYECANKMNPNNRILITYNGEVTELKATATRIRKILEVLSKSYGD